MEASQKQPDPPKVHWILSEASAEPSHAGKRFRFKLLMAAVYLEVSLSKTPNPYLLINDPIW